MATPSASRGRQLSAAEKKARAVLSASLVQAIRVASPTGKYSAARGARWMNQDAKTTRDTIAGKHRMNVELVIATAQLQQPFVRALCQALLPHGHYIARKQKPKRRTRRSSR